MARKGYSLGSLTDYVNTKFNIAGGEITGDMNVKGVLKEKGQRVYSPNNKPTAVELNVFNAFVEEVTTQDWNTLTQAGSYRVDNATGTNFPSVFGLPLPRKSGTLLVQNTGWVVTQLYVGSGFSSIYTRVRWGNAWNAWSATASSETLSITESIDLDNLSHGGTYNMYKSSGATFTNAPSDFDFGTLQVIGQGRTNLSFVTQILTWRNSSKQMIRTRNDGGMSWTPWSKIYSESQKPTAADVGALATTGGIMTGVISTPSVNQFRGPSKGAVDLDSLASETAGDWGYTMISSGATNSFPVANNANGVLTFNLHGGKFNRQIGFSSNGAMYTRTRGGTGFYVWRKLYDEANKPTPAELGAVNKAGDTMTGDLLTTAVRSGANCWLGTSGNDVFVRNAKSNKYLQLGNDGILRYDSTEIPILRDNYTLGNASRYYPRAQVRATGENALWELHIPGKYAAALVLDPDDGDLKFWETNGNGAWTKTYGYWKRANGELYGHGNGNFNDVYIRSDERLKTDRKPLSDALEKVCALQGYTYIKQRSLTDTTCMGEEAGILAQDLEKVLPQAVNTAEDTQKTISNSGVNALLVEAVKELSAKVSELEAKILIK